MQEIYFDEIDSTQKYAKQLVSEGKSDFVVCAKTQTLGRGRLGRTWNSNEGGLWFSFDIDFNNAGELFTMGIGVAVREVCSDIYEVDVKLKWPNDIILEGKKAGGILCERIGNKVIVGVGLNTNNIDAGTENSITFKKNRGKEIDNNIIMKTIIKKCKRTINDNLSNIVPVFRENMAFLGETCFVSSLKENAKILNVTNTGHLLVEINNEIKEIFTGEISVKETFTLP